MKLLPLRLEIEAVFENQLAVGSRAAEDNEDKEGLVDYHNQLVADLTRHYAHDGVTAVSIALAKELGVVKKQLEGEKG